MLTLDQFAPVWGLPNASPFCMKLETYLRMANLEYQVDTDADVRKAPKGKLPYVEDKGQIIADFNLIIEYLKTTYGDPLDEPLSRADAAIALAMRRLIEENLYWALAYSRWIDDASAYGVLANILNDTLTSPLRDQAMQLENLVLYCDRMHNTYTNSLTK